MIDLCWQSLLSFGKEYPAVFTAVAFGVFWTGRYLLGHKLYWLTCWNRFENRTKWWQKLDLHDWEPIETRTENLASLRFQCKKCHGQCYTTGYVYSREPFFRPTPGRRT